MRRRDIKKTLEKHIRYALDCRLHHHAASLAYSSLLALIPILTIVVWMLHETTFSHKIVQETETWILSQVTGDTNAQLMHIITNFINDTYHHISWLTLGCLLISLLLLITNTETSFNGIWQVTPKTKQAINLLQHTAIFLLLPAILALTFVGKINLSALWPTLNTLWPLVSALLRWALLCALYWYLPRTHVAPKSALIGGSWASVLLFLTQQGLNLYFNFFSALQSFYGSLWMIPTFLLWVYLAWIMILTGALITYLHQQDTAL